MKVREDFTITVKAPNRAFSWLKVPTCAFTFKTLCWAGMLTHGPVGAFSLIVKSSRTFIWPSFEALLSMMQSDFIGDILIFGLGVAAPLSAPSLHHNQMFNIGWMLIFYDHFSTRIFGIFRKYWIPANLMPLLKVSHWIIRSADLLNHKYQERIEGLPQKLEINK